MYRLLNKLKNKIRIHKVVYLEDAVPYLNLKIKNKKTLQKYLILDLKYRKFTGFRLEARGRLTKRHTASRSVTKVKYKGNLWNIDSRCGHLSSVLLKGNLDSNLQYTKLKGKTNIGSFGLKGWVSGNT